MFKNNYEKTLKLVSKLNLKFENKLNELTFLLPNDIFEKTEQYDDFTFENCAIFANQETENDVVRFYAEQKNDDKIFCISTKKINIKEFLEGKYKLILDAADIIFSNQNIVVRHSISLLKNAQQIEIIEEINFLNKHLNQKVKEPIHNRKNMSIEHFKSLIGNQTLNIN